MTPRPHLTPRPYLAHLLALLVLTLLGCAIANPLAPPTAATFTIITIPPSATPPPVASPAATATATPPAARTPTPSPTLTNTPVPLPSPTATALPSMQLAAVGDVMLARSIGQRILDEGPQVAFEGVISALLAADVFVANLETAISERGEAQPKAYTFRAPPAAADALALAGVDVVSLANNHAFDYGVLALEDTIRLLDAQDIAAVGAGMDAAEARAPIIIEHNGMRLAFLGYVDVFVENDGFDTRRWIAGADTPGVAWAVPEEVAADVVAARAQADVVVVMLHFGLEGRVKPWEPQQIVARAAIDAGAALVLGAHPHVLQPVEHYNGGLIVYSLGNFVFDGFGFPANYSAIFNATLTPDGVAEYKWIPVIIDNGLPRFATDAEAAAILPMVRQLAGGE